MCPYHRESLEVFDCRVQVPEHIVQITGNSEGSFVQNRSPMVAVEHTQCSQTALIKRPEKVVSKSLHFDSLHTSLLLETTLGTALMNASLGTALMNYASLGTALVTATLGTAVMLIKLHRKLSHMFSRQERTPVHSLIVC